MRWTTRGTVFLVLFALALGAGCARSPEAKKARYLERGDRYFKQQQYREAVIEYTNALRIEGNNTRAIRQLGLAHYELGQLSQAVPFLLKAEQLEPDNSEVALKLATVYVLGGRPEDARREADRVLAKDSNNLEALILWAGAAASAAETDTAIRRLESARPMLEREARFHLTMASLYVRKQNLPMAEGEFRTALALEPKSAETHLTVGNFYALKGAKADAEREFKTAADLAPDNARIQLRWADFSLSMQKSEQARKILTDITSKSPDYLPAWRRLAEIAFFEGRLDETTKTLDVVLKKSPGDVDAHLLLGRVHLARHETDAAIKEFRTVLKAEPRFAPAHYQLGLALFQAGDVQQAKAELSQAINIVPNFADAVLALARVNLRSGAVQPAVDNLERLLANQPNLVGAQVLLSSAYLAQQKPAKAGEVARKLMETAPQDARGPDLLGVSLAVQGKRSEARLEFEKSLALAPGYVEPLNHLVAVDIADKQLDSAVERVKKQIALVPKSGAHQAILGDLYVARGDAKRAEQAYTRALELEPRLFNPHVALVNLYLRARQYDEALAKINALAKKNPGSPTPLVLSGIVYEIKGDIPQARSAYEKALTLAPRFPVAANNLAWIYSEYGGDKERALELAQTAKEEAPDDPRISDTLGWILYKRGIYQRALALLKESAGKLPSNPQVQYHLGMAYQQLGERDNARKALQLAVNSTDAFAGKDEARQALLSLK